VGAHRRRSASVGDGSGSKAKKGEEGERNQFDQILVTIHTDELQGAFRIEVRAGFQRARISR
jgi:hypothetical protein